MASGGTARTRDEGRRESPAWWTGDRIVAAIQAWAERTGEPPSAREWKRPSSSQVNAADGVPTGNSRPTTRLVIRVFGSWSEAIEAAGFTPRRPWRPRRSGAPSASTRGRPPNDIGAYALPIASAELSRRVEKVVGYPPLMKTDGRRRRAILKAEQNQPKLRLASDG